MRILLVLSAIAYALIGLSSRFNTEFIDMKSFDEAIQKSLFLIIGFSVLVGVLFFLWFKKAFPLGYAKQYRVVRLAGLPIMFSCVAFAVNQSWFFSLNKWFSTNGYETFLLIEKKEIIKNRKNILFRLHTNDILTGRLFMFKVDANGYSRFNSLDTLHLYIEKGAFDIYFAKEVIEEQRTGLEPAALSL